LGDSLKHVGKNVTLNHCHKGALKIKNPLNSGAVPVYQPADTGSPKRLAQAACARW
jgi:hypothetical protein